MKDEARKFLDQNGWPSPYGNYENELIDTMVEFAKEQLKERDEQIQELKRFVFSEGYDANLILLAHKNQKEK